MPNILDYIKWRGDLSFSQSEFNEVDNLILSRFAYLPLDGLYKNLTDTVTIKELYYKWLQNDIDEEKILQKEDVDLFPLIAESNRFGSLKTTMYINKISKQEEKQFSAVTILLPKNIIYISYRGTDNTLVGWKEDFNISLDIDIPSQKEAVKYLETTYKSLKQKMLVGGHSKGGNLAMYASIFCNKDIKNEILKVYNNDGPGLSKQIIDTEEYKNNLNKIVSYIPQNSIIGKLMYHEEKFQIIKSTQKGIMQHDLYTWQILGDKFIHLKEVTNESEYIDAVIKEWTTRFTPKQRNEFINIIYDIAKESNSDTLYQMSKNRFKTVGNLIKAYHKTSKKNKQIISQTLSELFNITKQGVFKNMDNRLNK